MTSLVHVVRNLVSLGNLTVETVCSAPDEVWSMRFGARGKVWEESGNDKV